MKLTIINEAQIKQWCSQHKIPGENLSDRPESEKAKLQSSLKPENYPELASKFLIEIIESEHALVKHKLKA